MPDSRLRDDTWWRTGLQYYVAGRWSVKSHLTMVAGNLFHHSFEMFFKARLLEVYSPEQLRSRFGHDLPKLWNAYKSVVGNQDLGKFDNVIVELHRWEEIRYVNLVKGYSSLVGWSVPSKDLPRIDTKDPEIRRQLDESSHYELYMVQIDELFNAVIESYPINPSVINAVLLSGEAKRIFNYQRPTGKTAE